MKIKLCVFAKQVEADRLLDALAAIFRYKHSTSEWELLLAEDGFALRTGAKDHLTLAKQVKAESKQKFLNTVKEVQGLLDKSEKELGTISNNGKALTGTGATASSLLVYDKDGRKRDALNLFFNGLSAEQRQQILDGKTLTISNPGDDDKFTHFISHYPHVEAKPEEASLKFVLGTDGFAPFLWIFVGSHGENHMGSRFDEREARKTLVEDWYTKYDQRTDAQEDKNIRVVKDVEEIPDNERSSEAAVRLLSVIAEAQGIPVIALLPPPDNGAGVTVYGGGLLTDTSPNGKKLAPILEQLGYEPFGLSHKWSNGVLVLRDAVAPFLEALRADTPPPPPPQPRVRQMQ